VDVVVVADERKAQVVGLVKHMQGYKVWDVAVTAYLDVDSLLCHSSFIEASNPTL
jgi:hypothetical protein